MKRMLVVRINNCGSIIGHVSTESIHEFLLEARKIETSVFDFSKNIVTIHSLMSDCLKFGVLMDNYLDCYKHLLLHGDCYKYGSGALVTIPGSSSDELYYVIDFFKTAKLIGIDFSETIGVSDDERVHNSIHALLPDPTQRFLSCTKQKGTKVDDFLKESITVDELIVKWNAGFVDSKNYIQFYENFLKYTVAFEYGGGVLTIGNEHGVEDLYHVTDFFTKATQVGIVFETKKHPYAFMPVWTTKQS